MVDHRVLGDKGHGDSPQPKQLQHSSHADIGIVDAPLPLMVIMLGLALSVDFLFTKGAHPPPAGPTQPSQSARLPGAGG